MKRVNFNRDWTCRCLTREGEALPVALPHDAMISEPRSNDSVAEGNIGWYIGGDYEYVKRFDAPEEWQTKTLLLEFEGVMRDAEVFINGRKAGHRPYGYTNFYVNPAPFLSYGAENELRVVAHNAEQPNSRWYPGTGIYRPVWLHLADKACIPVNGVRIRTLSIRPVKIEVTVKTSVPGAVKPTIITTGTPAPQASQDNPLARPTKNVAPEIRSTRSCRERSPVKSSAPKGMALPKTPFTPLLIFFAT